jgi:hypothetical protein
MICSNCGAELEDDFNFCPFCEEILNKESINSNKFSAIIPRNKLSNGSIKEGDLKDKISNYAFQNQESSFTISTLLNKINYLFDDTNESKTPLKTIEGVLNEMVWDGTLKATHHNGETHYFINQGTKVTSFEEKNIISTEEGGDHEKENGYKYARESRERIALQEEANQIRREEENSQLKQKFTPLVQPNQQMLQKNSMGTVSRPKKQTDSAILVLVIISIIGVILMISGISSVFRTPSTGITLIVISIILLGIGTKGRIFLIFLACDDCDCDC